MPSRRILLSTLLASLALVGTAAAVCIPTTDIGTDAAMLQLIQDKAFVVEGRWGDLGGAAEKEIQILNGNDFPQVNAHYAWPNGVPVDFSVVYDALTNEVTFTVDGNVLQWTTTGSGFTQMFLRAYSETAGSSVLLSDLALGGNALCDDVNAVAGVDQLAIRHLPDATLENGFTLTGKATLSWTGSPSPLRSRVAWQIKLATQAPVPVEETTWGRIKNAMS